MSRRRGGFEFQLDLFWDGTTNGADIQKVIDYAGTEFLQLENSNTGAGTADLRFGFNDTADFGPTLTINANQWHHVVATFDTEGNSVDGNGDLAGTATLSVDGVTIAEAVFKSNLGDGLNRPIAFGTFAGGVLGIIEFNGLIYSPTVSLLGRLPADFDGDGDVDLDDFNVLAANFGRLAGANFDLGDGDGDGDVDLDDFNVLAANFGASDSESIASVPEPGGLLLLASLMIATCASRRWHALR